MRVIRVPLFLLVVAALQFPAQPQLFAQIDKSGAARMNLRYFLSGRADADALADLLDSTRDIVDREDVRQNVASEFRAAFVAEWITGSDVKGIDPTSFGKLASELRVFPNGPNDLLLLTISEDRVSAWNNDQFCGWLKHELAGFRWTDKWQEEFAKSIASRGAEPVKLIALLTRVLPAPEQPQLKELCRSEIGSRVKHHSLGKIVDDLAEVDKLAEQASQNGQRDTPAWKHYRGVSESAWQVIGNHVNQWDVESLAVRGVASVARHQSDRGRGLLRKITTFLAMEPAATDPNLYSLVQEIVSGLDPEIAYSELKPDRSHDWFLRLHETEILPELHHRSSNPQSSPVFQGSLELLNRWTKEEGFGSFYKLIIDHYYPVDSQQVFDELIEPQVSGKENRRLLVTEHTIRELKSEHRERIGELLLEGGSPESPAWPGAGKEDTRLMRAMLIYAQLVDENTSPSNIAKQFDSELLQGIVGGIGQQLSRPDSNDEGWQHLGRVVGQLAAYRRRLGGRMDAPPLSKLGKTMGQRVVKASDRFSEVLRQSDDRSSQEAIDIFVRQLEVALKAHRLMSEFSRKPEWWNGVIRCLKDVFANDRKLSDQEWRFVARCLHRLDRPLRDVLSEFDSEPERREIFDEIYLPLVTVPKFLKYVHEYATSDQKSGDWPFRAWCRPGGLEVCEERLANVFQRLSKSAPVESEDAILDLCELHARLVGRGSIGSVSPDEFFAGHWSAENTNIFVWMRLWNENLNAIRFECVPAMAEHALSQLPMIIESGRSMEADRIWTVASWVHELVRISEYYLHPITVGNNQLRWQTPGPVTSLSSVHWHSAGFPPDAKRRVDGTNRFKLASTLLNCLEPQEAIIDREVAAQRLAIVAGVATMLPNSQENHHGTLEQLRSYGEVKERVFARLRSVLARGGSLETRILVFRALAQLHASGGSDRFDAESFDKASRLVRSAEGLSGDEAGTLRIAVAGIDLEHASIVDRDFGQLTVQDARRQLGSALQSVSPTWSTRSFIELRHFGQRLGPDELRVEQMLAIRSRLRKLLGDQNPRTAEQLAEDVDIIARTIRLLDDTIWFSAGLDNLERYLEPRNGRNGAQWWPALFVLGWLEVDFFQQHAIRICAEYEQIDSSPRAMAKTDLIRRKLASLNETAFAAVRAVMNDDRAREMLSFQYRLPPKSALDVQLLLRRTQPGELVSASKLVDSCFRGVVLHWTLQRKQPSRRLADEEFRRRLLPAEGGGTGVDPDSVIRTAIQWQRSSHAPEQLRRGADHFIKTPPANLLDGAGTVDVVFDVLRVFAELSMENPDIQYRRFFDKAFLNDSQRGLGEAVFRAMSVPFRSIDATAKTTLAEDQRRSIERLLEQWRMMSGDPGTSSLASALAQDGGRLILRLLTEAGVSSSRSDDRIVPGAWYAAHQLGNQSSSISRKPVAFLDLTKWCLSLERPDDAVRVKSSFQGETAPLPLLRHVYEERCHRDADTVIRFLDQHNQRIVNDVANENTEILDLVNREWKLQPRIVQAYNHLGAVRQRYLDWAAEDGLVEILPIRTHSATKREWTALFPLLGRHLKPVDRLRWRRPGNPIRRETASLCQYQFFAALGWTSPGSSSPPSGHLVRELVSHPIGEWLDDAALDDRESVFQTVHALDGQYSFSFLLTPPEPSAEPCRLDALVSAIRVTPGMSDDQFWELIHHKEQFLTRLLQYLIAHPNSIEAKKWFCACSTTFPPLTAMHPERRMHATGFRAIRERDVGSPLGRLMKESLDDGNEWAKDVRASIYRYQIDRCDLPGIIMPTERGSTIYLDTPRESPTKQQDGASNHGEPATDITLSCSEDDCERRIAEWVKSKLLGHLSTPSLKTFELDLSESEYYLAISQDVLADELGLALASSASNRPADIVVRIHGVDGQLSKTLNVEMIVREEQKERTIGPEHVTVTPKTVGPWTSRFAVRKYNVPINCIGIAVIVVLVVLWWRLYEEQRSYYVLLGLFVVFTFTIAIVFVLFAPRSRPDEKHQGTVELVLPNGDWVPDVVNKLGRKLEDSLRANDQLADQIVVRRAIEWDEIASDPDVTLTVWLQNGDPGGVVQQSRNYDQPMYVAWYAEPSRDVRTSTAADAASRLRRLRALSSDVRVAGLFPDSDELQLQPDPKNRESRRRFDALDQYGERPTDLSTVREQLWRSADDSRLNRWVGTLAADIDTQLHGKRGRMLAPVVGWPLLCLVLAMIAISLWWPASRGCGGAIAKRITLHLVLAALACMVWCWCDQSAVGFLFCLLTWTFGSYGMMLMAAGIRAHYESSGFAQLVTDQPAIIRQRFRRSHVSEVLIALGVFLATAGVIIVTFAPLWHYGWHSVSHLGNVMIGTICALLGRLLFILSCRAELRLRP